MYPRAYSRFNSIVVRLKARRQPARGPRIISFNSIVVRLKVVRPTVENPQTALFQFHSGSIKSKRVKRQARWPNRRFNSIVVRLKGICKRPFCISQRSFNSIVVRLKGAGAGDGERARPRFNSIVVRLKDTRNPRIRISGHGFQFHSGSIKRNTSISM